MLERIFCLFQCSRNIGWGYIAIGTFWQQRTFNDFFNLRIDDIEDEIYREKLKIKKVSDELSDTFDDMLDNYWFKNWKFWMFV